MAMVSVLLDNDTVRHSPQEIYDWLQAQSLRLGFDIVLHGEEAEMKGFYLYIPAYLPSGKDAYDYAVKLQKLEDAWNDQEPSPNPPITLVPARSPEQRAAWEQLWKARDRKNEAADAAAAATGEEDQQRALSELRVARAAEVQAEEDYETFYQLKSKS